MNARKFVRNVIAACVFGLAAAGAAQASTRVKADFNGDGFEDLAIGVPGETINGQTNAGAVKVIYGSPSGLVKSTGKVQTFFQSQPGIVREFSEKDDFFGSTLTTGDFNGDGFADLAIGVPFEDFNGGVSTDPTDRGEVIVVYGSPVGLNFQLRDFFTQDKAGMLDDAEPFDRFGYSLAAGDFNGDGRDDLAIGVPSEDVDASIVDAGGVNVIFGSATGLTLVDNQFLDQLVFSDFPASGERFGLALAGQGNRVGGSAGFSGAWVRIAEHCGRECRLQGRLDVNNPGTALAAASIVRFYLSNDETLDGSDILIEQTKLDPLGPGETVRVKLRAEVPTGTAKGRFVIAVLDATDVVPEINEANNIVVSEVIQ